MSKTKIFETGPKIFVTLRFELKTEKSNKNCITL